MHSTEDMVPSAMLRAQASSGVLLDAGAQGGFAAAEGALGQVLAEDGPRAQLLGAVATARSRNGPLGPSARTMAPRWASRVLTASFQDGVQELVFAFQVAEVVAGPQQGQELFAGARAAVAVQGQVLDGLVPAAGRGRLDHQAVGGQVADLGVAAVGQDIDHHG